ncbi:MAG: hypothetical protein HYY78_01890 [Betaproteobacteria bacterium]|nr:hypothetical protein [Betaproteobacteria bacterium]
MSARPMPADADLLALLIRIDAKLDRLLEAVEGGRTPARSLRHEDRAAMAKILPVLSANFSGSFGTWELIDAAMQPDALGANLRLVLGGRGARVLGKLFQRAQDQDVDGFRLRRAGQDGNGALWECIGNESS